MSHRNAPLTPTGRARLVSLIIDHGWSRRRAAERLNVSPATGPDPRVVDTLTPAMSWGRKVVFHHAPEDLLGAVQA